MKRFFLRAKHWHLFLLIFALPLVSQLVGMGFFFEKILNAPNYPASDPMEGMMQSMMVTFFAAILAYWVFFAWLGHLSGLQKMIPQELRKKRTLYLISQVFVALYLPGFMIFVMFMMGNIESQIFDYFPAAFAVIMPLHLLTMIAMIYNYYFVARTLKTAELQREVTLSDFILEIILLWFYPVGIWLIQPRVNKLFAQEEQGLEALK